MSGRARDVSEQEAQQIDVVGERLDGHPAQLVRIAAPAARGSQAGALTQEHHRLPKVARFQQLLALPPRLVEAEVEPDGGQRVTALGRRGDRPAILERGGQRLLAVDVPARFEAGEDLLPVMLGRGAHPQHIGFLYRLLQAGGGAAARERGELLRVLVADIHASGEPHTLDIAERLCMLSGNVSRSNQPNPDLPLCHVECLPA